MGKKKESEFPPESSDHAESPFLTLYDDYPLAFYQIGRMFESFDGELPDWLQSVSSDNEITAMVAITYGRIRHARRIAPPQFGVSNRVILEMLDDSRAGVRPAASSRSKP